MAYDLLPKGKVFLLVLVLLVWVGLGVTFKLLMLNGVIAPLPVDEPLGVEQSFTVTNDPADRLLLAQRYVDSSLVRDDGHVILYEGDARHADNRTNSEAVSYYLYWKVVEGDKESFDAELDYMERFMLDGRTGHMRWRLEADGSVTGDGINIASDADLRAIGALMIAEDRWGDERYTRLIDQLAKGLEKLAVTDDKFLAPYGGPAGRDDSWTANEVYLSYVDFRVMKALAQRRGEPWVSVHDNMKKATLNAQIHNGLYNSYLNSNRQYGNGIDGGDYSINSMWMMVRAAESDDPQLRASAYRSLDFYKEQFARDAEIYGSYSSSGSPTAGSDAPWAYALVARAAIALDDSEFADRLVAKLLSKQVIDPESSFYGGIPEGSADSPHVGQFTMQESIMTLQDYVVMRSGGQ